MVIDGQDILVLEETWGTIKECNERQMRMHITATGGEMLTSSPDIDYSKFTVGQEVVWIKYIRRDNTKKDGYSVDYMVYDADRYGLQMKKGR